jgi:ribonuclease HI
MVHVPTIVFTDGAAKGNPGPGGWGVIIVTPEQQVTELGGGAPHTTNNKMELSAAIAALEHLAVRPGPVIIYTDSTYVIQGITQWVWGWRKRGWKTSQGSDVLNRDLWERLSGLLAARPRGDVDWRWVRGHVGTPGNERVDAIAVAFSLQQSCGSVSRCARWLLAVGASVAGGHDVDEAGGGRRLECTTQDRRSLVRERRRRSRHAAPDVVRVRGARKGTVRCALQEGRKSDRRVANSARMGNRSG